MNTETFPLVPIARVFDRRALLERVDGDEILLNVIIEVFLADLPDARRAIADALHGGDAHALRDAAHSLKGAAANISAEALRDATHALERIAQSHSLADAAAAVEKVDSALAALQPWLERLIERDTPEC